MVNTRWIFVWGLLIMIAIQVNAQVTPDSTKTTTPTETPISVRPTPTFELKDPIETEPIVKKEEKAKGPNLFTRLFVKSEIPPRPKRSALLSAVLPGAGQIYNRRAWKAPLVWGGLAGLGYGIVWNTRQYRRFRDAFRIRKDEIEGTFDEFCVERNGTRVKVLSDADIAFRRDAARKDMELTYIWFTAIWGLNVLEAFVDAHLQNFDINDDLSFKVSPSFINPGQATAGAWGVGVKFLF